MFKLVYFTTTGRALFAHSQLLTDHRLHQHDWSKTNIKRKKVKHPVSTDLSLSAINILIINTV